MQRARCGPAHGVVDHVGRATPQPASALGHPRRLASGPPGLRAGMKNGTSLAPVGVARAARAASRAAESSRCRRPVATGPTAWPAGPSTAPPASTAQHWGSARMPHGWPVRGARSREQLIATLPATMASTGACSAAKGETLSSWKPNARGGGQTPAMRGRGGAGMPAWC